MKIKESAWHCTDMTKFIFLIAFILLMPYICIQGQGGPGPWCITGKAEGNKPLALRIKSQLLGELCPLSYIFRNITIDDNFGEILARINATHSYPIKQNNRCQGTSNIFFGSTLLLKLVEFMTALQTSSDIIHTWQIYSSWAGKKFP